MTYKRAIADHQNRSQKVPADLLAKRDDMIAGISVIRKQFAVETQKNPKMQPEDQISLRICDAFKNLAKNHNMIITLSASPQPAKKKPPVCSKKDLMPRFIAATRKQRKLMLAGKVTGKERVNYLKIANEFKKTSKTNFDKACRTLHRYEKMLTAEKSEQ